MKRFANLQTFFSSVYAIDMIIVIISFDECFLFYVINRKHFCYISLSFLWVFCNRHVITFFETSVLKEVRILR